MEVHVRGLKALGVSSKSCGSLLSSVLMNKIPQDLHLIVSREIKGGDWELDLLLKVLHQEPEASERAAGSQNTYSPTRTHHIGEMISLGMIPLRPQLSRPPHEPPPHVPIVNSLVPPTSSRPWLMCRKGKKSLEKRGDVMSVLKNII